MSDEERSASEERSKASTAGEHRSLMADLRAAVDDATARGRGVLKLHMETRDLTKLLALLEAGKACRDWAEQYASDTLEPKAPECVRQYDEAAK